MKRIGIPRALLYYYFYPLWREFFTGLGMQVVVSPETNKRIMDAGVKVTLSEVCLPVKILFGHVLALADEVDYLFVPRIIKVEPRAYICPKFMGLPDMLRARIPDLPPLLEPAVDMRKEETDPFRCWENCFREVGRVITRDKRLV
ncbi:MAG: CoA enzyme activase, partial [Thermacetogenium phaeum]